MRPRLTDFFWSLREKLLKLGFSRRDQEERDDVFVLKHILGYFW